MRHGSRPLEDLTKFGLWIRRGARAHCGKNRNMNVNACLLAYLCGACNKEDFVIILT